MPGFKDVRALAPSDAISSDAIEGARHALQDEISGTVTTRREHSATSRGRRDRTRSRTRRGFAVTIAFLGVIVVAAGVTAGIRLMPSIAPVAMESTSPTADEPEMLACGTGRFISTKISQPQYADELDDAGALLLSSAGGIIGSALAPTLGEVSEWIVVEQTADTLRLLRPLTERIDSLDYDFDVITIGSQGGVPVVNELSSCTLIVDLENLDGLDYAQVMIDPEAGLDPESSEIHLLVLERECNGGRDATGRVVLRAVEETETEVRLSIGIRPGNGGDCPSNPATAFVVELDSPLGDRIVTDGVRYPAREMEVGDFGYFGGFGIGE